MNKVKISFVIPTYNEALTIRDCIASIKADLARTSVSAEIIVVDNASTDRTQEIARAIDGVMVVDEKRKGVVRARQTGVDVASGDLVAHIDADNRLPNGWIKRALSEFERDENLVGLSGPYIYYDTSLFVREMTLFYFRIGYLIALLLKFLTGRGGFMVGGNIVVKRSAVISFGGYDTSINFYGDDTSMANQLAKVGKVKFSFALPILSSGRRLKQEGVLAAGGKYVLNYIWVTAFGRPFHNSPERTRTHEADSTN